jgi:hypothetical protein
MADKSWDELISDAGDEFNLLPEGDYQATIREAVATVSKNSGNQMIECTVKVSEGPHSGKSIGKVFVSKPGPGTKPEKLEGAARMFFRHLKAVGITTDTLKTHNPTMAQIAAVMQGKAISVKVKHESYNGVEGAKHQGPLLAPSGGAMAVTEFPSVAATDHGSIREELNGAGAPRVGAIDPGF